MPTKWIPAMALGVIVLTVAFAPAQETPSGKWWRVPRIAERLHLEKSEIQALEDHYIQSRRRLIELKRDVEKERFELETMLEKRSVDEKSVKRQFQRLENARTKLASERLAYAVNVRKIIGYDKFQELQALYQQSRAGD